MSNFLYRALGVLAFLGIAALIVWQWQLVIAFSEDTSALALMFALFFPGTAALYFLFELNVRKNEILGAANDYRLHRVYYPDSTEEDSKRRFIELLNRRFDQYYPVLELATFSLAAGILAYVLEIVIVHLLKISPWIEQIPPAFSNDSLRALLLAAGFCGGIAGSYTLILKKYRGFDVYPSTYFQAIVGITLGALIGAFVVPVLTLPTSVATPTSENRILMALAFSIAFFAAKQIDYVSDMLSDLLKTYKVAQPTAEMASDLGAVMRDSSAIDSLVNLGLASIAEVATATPLTLYLNLPQPIGVINGWLDELLLNYYYAGSGTELHRVGIRRFTQLIERFAPGLAIAPGAHATPRSLVWAGEGATMVTGNAALDVELRSSVKEIVEGQVHHSVLATIWPQYRQVFCP